MTAGRARTEEVALEAGSAIGAAEPDGDAALGATADEVVDALGAGLPAPLETGAVVAGRVGADARGAGALAEAAVTVGAVTIGVVTTGAVGAVGVVTPGVVMVGVVTIGVVTGGMVTDGPVTVGTVTDGSVGVVTPSAAGAIAPRAAAAARARTRLTGDKREKSRIGCGFRSHGKTLTVADTDVQVRVETCRIELWRGYVSASFVARSTEGEGEAVSEPSKSFRWRSSSAPDTQHAKLAHYLLLMRLKHEGWSESGEGDEWYDVELARPIAVPLNDEPEPEPLPEVVHVEPEPLPPPLPATVMSNVVPLPVTETERARDPWRVTAAIGLAVALLFLLVLLRT